MQAKAINSGGSGFLHSAVQYGTVLSVHCCAYHKRDFCFSPLSVPVAGGKTLTLVPSKDFSTSPNKYGNSFVRGKQKRGSPG